jgi:hypothetical protein
LPLTGQRQLVRVDPLVIHALINFSHRHRDLRSASISSHATPDFAAATIMAYVTPLLSFAEA